MVRFSFDGTGNRFMFSNSSTSLILIPNTVTVSVVVSEPHSLVAVSVTVNVPFVVYVWLVLVLLSVGEPSPKFQLTLVVFCEVLLKLNVGEVPLTVKDGEAKSTIVVVMALEAAEAQPFSDTVTVKVLAVLTVISCVVSPLDQVFPELALEDKVMELPSQMAVEADAVMVGVAGVAVTVKVWLDVCAHPYGST